MLTGCLRISKESIFTGINNLKIGTIADERFYRVDKSRSKELGGTGLGLSIVKHAARLHQASIDLQSMEKKGTTITVMFPVDKQ